jgi:hypothetical protein
MDGLKPETTDQMIDCALCGYIHAQNADCPSPETTEKKTANDVYAALELLSRLGYEIWNGGSKLVREKGGWLWKKQ